MQVPDAVYYMMRNTPLVACNISSNVITKIPPKLTVKFSFIKREFSTEFILSSVSTLFARLLVKQAKQRTT